VIFFRFEERPLMAKPTDPTKDPAFQGVIQHFLKTPPKPFTPKAKTKTEKTKSKAARGKNKKC
jgi:hypothetical protein